MSARAIGSTYEAETAVRNFALALANRYGKAEQRPRNCNDWEVEAAMFFAIARDPLWFIDNGYRFDYRVRIVKDSRGRIIDAYGTAAKEEEEVEESENMPKPDLVSKGYKRIAELMQDAYAAVGPEEVVE